MILSKSFFNRNTIEVAQDLLGCFLIRKIGNQIIKTKIIETEAYCGPNDLASHASRGKTARNEVMFGPAGIIYIYLIYGMYYMLNIVTEETNYPAAVLVRGLDFIETNNKKSQLYFDLKGPGKLSKNLKIDKKFNALPIYTKKYGLWIENRQEKISLSQIKKAKRIGVDYAKEYKDKLWRFYLEESN